MAGPPPLPNHTSGAALFDGWRAGVLSGTKPVMWPVGRGDLAAVQVGPGRVVLVGGAPGAGKSALVTQWVFDALRITPGLRAAVCNVEMRPDVLLDRQLARLARVPLTDIQGRTIAPDKLAAGLDTLRPLAARVTFVGPPYSLDNVALAADAFGADLIVLDYVQRIAPSADPRDHRDKRAAVDATMGMVREFADAGRAVICVAAVGRSKDKKGRNSYAGDDLSLGSFRESSELEYGADDAYLLCPAADDNGPAARLRHLKARYGRTRHIDLAFNKPFQAFVASEIKSPKEPAR